jgi:hypothetical protein
MNQHSPASALASMLDRASFPAHVWSNDELAAVLQHQLAAPVSVDLGTLRGMPPDRVLRLADGAVPPIRTFSDLLRHPAPPLDLLESTKRFAKLARDSPQSALPMEVAAVLYFGSIAAARNRCGKNISNLPDPQLRQGVQWVMAQPWLDHEIRALFENQT